ncbi:Uncharacterized protein FVE85_2044 [Porphyridium purpureum]|uniref:Protein kinase domain-containing protein n=1 Tax=Porphyridium purpureum TaxID=35688 RepID=A0A5J4YWE8_PORPP|nr:Uncharacterized protein FVE85_2044 [Porphyridium purpureum]|eukprot:POR0169..scf209_3
MELAYHCATPVTLAGGGSRSEDRMGASAKLRSMRSTRRASVLRSSFAAALRFKHRRAESRTSTCSPLLATASPSSSSSSSASSWNDIELESVLKARSMAKSGNARPSSSSSSSLPSSVSASASGNGTVKAEHEASDGVQAAAPVTDWNPSDFAETRGGLEQDSATGFSISSDALSASAVASSITTPVPSMPRKAIPVRRAQEPPSPNPMGSPDLAGRASSNGVPPQLELSNASDEMEKGWSKRGTSLAWVRALEVWGFFLKFLFAELKLRKKTVEERAKAREILSVTLRKGLLALGPTFIKVGQLLSTRVDIIPEQYVKELCLLQDRVPGFSAERARSIIVNDLGVEADELFDSFDSQPIAAASLGQVHRAVYRGREVVVKIQRAGLKELFDMDLKNLKLLAVLLDKIDPKTDGADRNWVGIYDESAKLLYQEIDYELEAENAKRFAYNFRDIEWVKVPEVFEEASAARVLTLEYCPGVKTSDVEGIKRLGLDPVKIAARSGESYLNQLLRHGFFHCDPHPGNVAVDSTAGGRLVYYDFGMMAELEPRVKRGLVELVFGVFEGSSKEVCDALEKMGVLRPNVDRVSVEKVGRFFLDAFRSVSVMPKMSNDPAKQKAIVAEKMTSRLSTIGSDLLTLTDDAPFRFPATFTFVFRAFTTLEGIGKTLDPSYDLTRIAQPYLKDLLDLKDGSAFVSIAKSWQKRLGWRWEDIKSLVQAPRRVAYVSQTLEKMEQGDLKVRVRALENEQSFKRVTALLEVLGTALITSLFLNAALMFSVSSGTATLVTSASSGAVAQRFTRCAKLMWILAFLTGARTLISIFKVAGIDKKQKRFSGNT